MNMYKCIVLALVLTVGLFPGLSAAESISFDGEAVDVSGMGPDELVNTVAEHVAKKPDACIFRCSGSGTCESRGCRKSTTMCTSWLCSGTGCSGSCTQRTSAEQPAGGGD